MTRPRSGYRGGFDRDDDRGYDRGPGRGYDRGYDRGGSGGYDRSSSRDGGAASFFESSLREHPLLLGLGAALAGAVVGTLIPDTRHEHEAMGEYRNRLVDEGMQRGHRVAREALSSAERAIDAAVEEFANEFESAASNDTDEGSEKGSGAKASASSGDAGDARKRTGASAAARGDSATKSGDVEASKDDPEKESGA